MDVGHCGSLGVVAGRGNETPKLQTKANSKFGDGSGVTKPRKTSGLQCATHYILVPDE